MKGWEEPVTPPDPFELSEVILEREEAVIKRGETLVLSYTVEPEGVSCGQAVWISSDPSVATVDQSGKVVAVSTGTAEITVTVDTKSDICLITVYPVMPESISLDIKEQRLLFGGSFRLTATVSPEDADDKDVTWSSSDGTVASVSEDGTGMALAAGEAVITAACGDLSDDCHIEVAAMPMLGDYYYSDGTWSTELDASKETIGIVFYMTPDKASGKILSLDEFYDPDNGEYASYTMWCTGEMEEIGCNHEFEGRLNMDIMKEHPGWEENYPPFKWCADKTDGGLNWYLPETAELSPIICGLSCW